jgi:hypothetical protein
MKDVQKGNIVFECDGCSDVIDTNIGDGESAMNVFKREGWQAQKGEDETWFHWCKKCKE